MEIKIDGAKLTPQQIEAIEPIMRKHFNHAWAKKLWPPAGETNDERNRQIKQHGRGRKTFTAEVRAALARCRQD